MCCRRKTIDEIVLAVARLLSAKTGRPTRCRGTKMVSPQLFVSHAKAGLRATNAAAKGIHDYVVTDSTGRAISRLATGQARW